MDAMDLGGFVLLESNKSQGVELSHLELIFLKEKKFLMFCWVLGGILGVSKLCKLLRRFVALSSGPFR